MDDDEVPTTFEAGAVAKERLNGTLWVCSPRTKGQNGEWRSCSDL
jgi:hypothetical protein